MPSSRCVVKSGIWTTLLLSSIAFLAFHYYDYHSTERKSIGMSATLDLRDQLLRNRQQLQSVNHVASSNVRDSQNIANLPDHYFDLYPKEILTTLEGTYSLAFNDTESNNIRQINQDLVVAEILPNRGATGAILPGIAFIDDLHTNMIKHQGSQLLNSKLSSPISNSHLTPLNLESLPNSVTVLRSSDSRVSVEETVLARANFQDKKGN